MKQIITHGTYGFPPGTLASGGRKWVCWSKPGNWINETYQIYH